MTAAARTHKVHETGELLSRSRLGHWRPSRRGELPSGGSARLLATLVVAILLGCGGPDWKSEDSKTRSGPTSRPFSGSAEAAPLEVSFGGCREVFPGPTCHLIEGDELRFWTRGSATASLHIDGPVELLGSRAVQAGTLHRLRVTAARGRLEVTAREHSPGARDGSGWRLEWRAPPSRPAHLERAGELFAAGRLDAAEEALRGPLERSEAADGRGSDGPGSDGSELRLLGRLERARGDVDAAAAALERALSSFRQRHRLRQAASCAAELAYLLIYDADRIGEARSLLEEVGAELGEEPDAPAEAHYDLAYLRGLLALNTGDVRGSLRWLEEAADVAERLGWTVLRMTAEQPLAHQLQKIGRGEEAAAIFSRHQAELPGELSSCDRAVMLNNLGWNLLLVREYAAGHGEDSSDPDDHKSLPEDPTPWLEEARRLFADRPCPESDERANVAVNLALAELQRDRPDQARHHLEQAEAYEAQPPLRSRSWRLDIAARIAMAEARPDAALELYDRLTWLAGESLSAQSSFKAAAGRAAALEDLERPDEALDAYAEAERHLNLASLAVPIDGGRETFVDRGSRVTRRHLDLLVDLGRTREAYELARRARSRVLRSLHRQSRLSDLEAGEQEAWDRAISDYRRRRRAFDDMAGETWRLPADQQRRRRQDRRRLRHELQRALDAAFATLDQLSPALDSSLPPLDGGEVRLIYFPGTRGWIGFAEHPGGVVARRLGRLAGSGDDSDPRHRLGEQLLEPFTRWIEGAERVRILPSGWLREVDFHALPFAGSATLLESLPVLYGLDLPLSPAIAKREPGSDRIRRALVVADPSEDLDAARAEGDLVADRLRRHASRWRIEPLVGSAATSLEVRRRLPSVELFHYAGHGVVAGRGGWRSALPLAAESTLTVADILALERAPHRVVLSACETARSAAEAQVESATGLAHAFLTVGSQSVLAALRPVEDRLASELVARYYAVWLDGEEPHEALRRAQLALRESDPTSDWSSFRLLVR